MTGPMMGEERTEALRVRVAAALGQQALKDTDLARLAGVDIHTVGRLLNEQAGITRHSAVKITRALGMSLAAAVAPLACRDMPPAGYRCLACGAETLAGAVAVVNDLVRLTFVTYEPGAARIMADQRQQVGLVLGEFYGVRAYLWPVAGVRPGKPGEVEQARFGRLRDARRVLRERVAERGAWWTA